MSFIASNRLGFINSFQFLSSLLDSLVKKIGVSDFKYLNQESDNNVLELATQKWFYPYEETTDLEKFNEKLLGKQRFYNEFNDRKISGNENEHVLTVKKKFKMKTIITTCIKYVTYYY